MEWINYNWRHYYEDMAALQKDLGIHAVECDGWYQSTKGEDTILIVHCQTGGFWVYQFDGTNKEVTKQIGIIAALPRFICKELSTE